MLNTVTNFHQKTIFHQDLKHSLWLGIRLQFFLWTLLAVNERFNWAVASCISRKKKKITAATPFRQLFCSLRWNQFKINCHVKYQLTTPFEGDTEFLSPGGVSQQPGRRSCRWHHSTLREVLGNSDSWLSWWTKTTDSVETPLLWHVAISLPPAAVPASILYPSLAFLTR